jgi:hypothetical protein
MATWLDEDGAVNIRYDGHMCIHEMLWRDDEAFIDSQLWIDEVMPTVEVVHTVVDYFNCFMINDHIIAMQQEYPKIKKIIVTKTSIDYRKPEYAVGFVSENLRSGFIFGMSDIIINFDEIHITPGIEIIIDESLSHITAKIITNHHSRLLLADMSKFYWARQDLGDYIEFPYSQGHVYHKWFMPLNRSNRAITWDIFKNMIYDNLNLGN